VVRLLSQFFYPAVLLASLFVPVVAGRALLRRVRAGAVGPAKSVGIYALAVLSPSLLYVAIVFALIGAEEVTGLALVPEEMARALLLVVGFGLAVWLLSMATYLVSIARQTRSRRA
jgi:hypothetical protein